MKHCIINLATENGWYPSGQRKLLASLERYNFDIDVFAFMGEKSVGSPSHQSVPYAFKSYAFNHVKDLGYEVILWLDCSMRCCKDVTPLFDAIEREGHVMELAGWSVGEWCTDAALTSLGVTRDGAMHMPLFSAGFLGLDLRNPRSAVFLRQWHEKAKDGVSFIGPWDNKNGSCSADKRVLGHRHDMTAASVLAHRLEMKLTPPTFMVYAGPETPDSACFIAKGEN